MGVGDRIGVREWGTGESTNCGSGGRESLLIVGVGDGRVD